ncbi:MAG: hypothetical protein ABIF71_08055 [Planctomycetota bacterium]
MARRSRIDFQGGQDRELFLHRLETALERTEVKCHAFALMPNHAHLLVTKGVAPYIRGV